MGAKSEHTSRTIIEGKLTLGHLGVFSGRAGDAAEFCAQADEAAV
jgi:hypothetical protein